MYYTSVLLPFLLVLILSGCNSSPSLGGKNVKKEYFTGGQLRSEFIIDDKTEQNGLLKKYGYDGHLTSIARIKNGVRHGVETGYDPKGRVLWRQYFVNGKQEGVQKAYYPNGDLMVTYTYKNGLKNGLAKTYRKDGSVDKKAMYVDDKLVH